MDDGERTGSGRAPFKNWSIWRLPRPALAYVLTIEALALAAVAVAITFATPASWGPLGLIAAGAMLHLHGSQAIERIRRDHSHLPHVDLCSVWILAGALVLPASAEVALVALIYLHRWLLVGRYDASRPPHRALFTTAMMTLAALGAGTIADVTGLRDHLIAGDTGWTDLAALIAVLAVQWSVNSFVVGGILLLTAKIRRKREVLGSAADNLLEFGQLVLGVFVALAAVRWPELMLLMVVPLYLVHQSVLLHQYRLAARTDSRTGLLNVEAWRTQAEAALLRARKERSPVAVMMLDLDYFKSINDSHGHAAGDTVLESVAGVLASCVRHSDAVGRMGGEEFAVLQAGVEPADALAVAERIRHSVGKLTIRDRAGAPVPVSVTIGVATWPECGETTIDGLLHTADMALYRGKHAGRNRVTAADETASVPASRRHRSAHPRSRKPAG